MITLPRDATPVDFAYDIHTQVGHHCVGAKVNGRIVPLRHKLKNGEIVEILTSKDAGPNRDWLGFVKTARARERSNTGSTRRKERMRRAGQEAPGEGSAKVQDHLEKGPGHARAHGRADEDGMQKPRTFTRPSASARSHPGRFSQLSFRTALPRR